MESLIANNSCEKHVKVNEHPLLCIMTLYIQDPNVYLVFHEYPEADKLMGQNWAHASRSTQKVLPALSIGLAEMIRPE